MHFAKVIAGALPLAGVMAHPGHDHTHEIAQRREYFESNKPRDLSHCIEKMKRSGLEQRAVQRRAKRTLELVAERSPKTLAHKKRALEDFLSVDHESTEGYTMDTNPADLFAGGNYCVLSPEVTEGPYYVSGEYVRQDNVEDQEGIPMAVDTQVIDINTCEPIPDLYIEIWHCNATGVYSGVVAQGNGVGESDPSNLDNTFLRGVQPTDEDGVATFNTIFPGHYTGRTTHIHVLVHSGAEPLANGTLYSTSATHVGQMFFDQDLIEEADTIAPYSSNTQTLTTNEEDNIASQEADSDLDPFMKYTLLGESLEDGLLAWLAFGVDLTAVKNITAAATKYESGGVANADAGSGMGGGPGGDGQGPGGNGTFSGVPPSGFPSGALPTESAAESTATEATSTESVSTETASTESASTESAVPTTKKGKGKAKGKANGNANANANGSANANANANANAAKDAGCNL
ncbi:related to protocatechuate 3,4-dioxygenase beta subunit [Cephalotrichum gorgonifer]|uniref:Related to protocatechuate 3,4-dioxygenase beta subunit n=1 Tax=Cephalotrichum gorgonifer TaxID=2041049 RepID=A0AAE8SZX3_9PEZI|nr:related to protocatechuate 3,4-dioxygenase beta subunit [Cephalotrichum gorgonifer]